MSDEVQERVLRFLTSPAGARPPAASPSETFEELARALFAFQYDRNPAYHRWCDALGCSPSGVRSIEEIPAVPTAAFKELELVCGPPVAEFRTSGSTGTGSGRHLMLSLEPYRSSALKQFQRCVLPEGWKMRTLILAPPPALKPSSSLSCMLSWVLEAYGEEGSGWYVSTAGLQCKRFIEALLNAQRDGVPVLLAGTTAAFLSFYDYCDALRARARLPSGSRLMDTGGQKGSGVPEPLPLEEFQARFFRRTQETLGIPEECCVNEYGMTELSSQFYDSVLLGKGGSATQPRVKVGPPWVRTFVMDPVTLEPCLAGQTGLLQHLDLANAGSVMAVLTEDLGHVAGEGFVLEGRPQAAEARGCGLTFEELMAGR